MVKYLTLLCLIINFISLRGQVARYDYKSLKENANFFDIVERKNQEVKNYNLKNIHDLKEWKHYMRWKLYWKDRINPDGSFPHENLGYFNAGILNNDGTISGPILSTRGSQPIWENIGPQNQSAINTNGYPNYPQLGRLNAFLHLKHPTDSTKDVFFVGAPNGGVWKSVNGGRTWEPKTDFLASIGVSDIQMAPDANAVNYTSKPIYVATGDYEANHSKSIGIIKSVDGGNTFTSTGLSFGVAPPSTEIMGDVLVINDSTLITGTKDFIKRSNDGGLTWRNVFGDTSQLGPFARFVKYDSTIIAMSTQGAIIKSTNNGVTWNTAIKSLSPFVAKIATYVSTKGKFFFQLQNGRIRQFDPSTNTASNFGTIVPGYDSQQGFNMALVVEDSIVLNGEINGSHSLDGGKSWYRSLNGYWAGDTTDGTYIHSDHHRLGILKGGNNKFWSVNDGGLSFIDYGQNVKPNTKPTITYKSESTIVTQSYSCSINPKDNSSFMMSNQDNDHYSKVGNSWYAVIAGDGIQSAINYNKPDIRYAVGQNGVLIKTTKGYIGEYKGNDQYFILPLDPEMNPASFYFPLEINKVNPTRLYAGGKDDIYLIRDSIGVKDSVSALGANVKFAQSIATHGSDGILAAAQKQMAVSNDGGKTWKDITLSLGELNINSVDFNAEKPNIMYYTVGGYTQGSKVFKSNDGGKTWSNITGTLPNIVVNKILLKQNQNHEILFLATELGVYYKVNENSWQKLGEGFPNVDVKDIEIHYTADKLVAATFGRGLWQVGLSTLINTPTQDLDANKNGFSIYPNPVTNDVLNIKYQKSSASSYFYQIYNVVGGVVKTGKLDSESINISNLAPNTYIIRLFNNQEQFYHKFIIQK